MRDAHERDPVAAFLLARAAAQATGTNDVCPSDTMLVGYVERRLLAAERDRVEGHLARCQACRDVVADVIGENDAEGHPSAAGRATPEEPSVVRTSISRSRRRWWVAAAAAALVAVGAWALTRSTAARAAPEAMLLARARELANAQPDLFSDFVPLAMRELLSTDASLVRGDQIVLVEPCGKTRATRPTFRCEAPPAVASFGFVLRSWDGRVLAERSTAAPVWTPEGPDLAPGMFVWEVSVEGADGRTLTGSRPFAVLPPDESATVSRALAAIERTLPEGVASLVAAHYLLRHEIYDEAVRAARSHLARAGGDRFALATLYQALERTGASEARALRARLQDLPADR